MRCRCARATGVESWLEGMERCTVYRGHARFVSPREVQVGDDRLTAEQHLHQCGRPRACSRHAGDRSRAPPDQHVDARARHAARSTWSWSAAAMSASSSRRCTAASAAQVTVVEKAPRLDRARGRGRVGRDQGHPRGGGHRGAPGGRVHPLRAAAARRSPSRVDCAAGEPEVIGSHVLLAIGPPPQHRRSRPRQSRHRASTSAATSSSTTRCAPACPASGRWATATAAAPSPTPPTTISRSSRPTCWTASGGGSATASPPTPSTSIRRSAASA